MRPFPLARKPANEQTQRKAYCEAMPNVTRAPHVRPVNVRRYAA